MSWSQQQEIALKSVRAWINQRRGPQVFRVFGYAGTGKTTLARELAVNAGLVLFGAFTGKAAHVLRKKGCTNARTIHSLIYVPDETADTWEPKFKLNPSSDVADADLVVIDECSMVDETLGRDLLSFGTKVLVLGDPAQLPPVKGAGYFTEATPDVMLTEVHRQARDNPIIAMSMTIREGGKLDRGDYGASKVIARDAVTPEMLLGASQIIVGLNRTRQGYNRRIRSLLGRKNDLPAKDDKLVCLRNDRERRLLNGSLWTVTKALVKGDTVALSVLPDDADAETRPTAVKVRREFFTGAEDTLEWEDKKGKQEFTYGYALTCHKSQGSQWPDTVVFDEAAAFREDAGRWRYTAITRAAERVTVVQGG